MPTWPKLGNGTDRSAADRGSAPDAERRSSRIIRRSRAVAPLREGMVVQLNGLGTCAVEQRVADDSYILKRAPLGSAPDDRAGTRERLFGARVLPERLWNDETALTLVGRRACILSTITHPHVISTYGLDTVLNTPVEVPLLLTELLAGAPLPEVLGQRDANDADGGHRLRPSIDSIAIVAAHALEALRCLHARGITHGRVSADALFLSGTRVNHRFVLTQVEGALAWGTTSEKRATRPASAAVLTEAEIACASPEVLIGEAVVPSSDLYSLSAVLYELITGRPLFAEFLDIDDVVRAHVGRAPDPLACVAPWVPDSMSTVLMRALLKDPNDRPTAREFLAPFEAQHRRIPRPVLRAPFERILSRSFEPLPSVGGGRTSEPVRDFERPSAPSWGASHAPLSGGRSVALWPESNSHGDRRIEFDAPTVRDLDAHAWPAVAGTAHRPSTDADVEPPADSPARLPASEEHDRCESDGDPGGSLSRAVLHERLGLLVAIAFVLVAATVAGYLAALRP